jgi:hypothetical protein
MLIIFLVQIDHGSTWEQRKCSEREAQMVL